MIKFNKIDELSFKCLFFCYSYVLCRTEVNLSAPDSFTICPKIGVFGVIQSYQQTPIIWHLIFEVFVPWNKNQDKLEVSNSNKSKMVVSRLTLTGFSGHTCKLNRCYYFSSAVSKTCTSKRGRKQIMLSWGLTILCFNPIWEEHSLKPHGQRKTMTQFRGVYADAICNGSLSKQPDV